MRNFLLIILLFTPVVLISCQPEQSSQYFLTFRWPADSIKNYDSAYLHLKPGLRVHGNNGLLIGMVSYVTYGKDSVDVYIMVDKKIPIGSKIWCNPLCLPSISIEYSKQYKYYCPGDIISGNVTLNHVWI
jgi:hypothetical protein